MNFLGEFMENQGHWLGGYCKDCTLVSDPKWQWLNGTALSVHDSKWVVEQGRRRPWDDGTHKAFYLTLEKSSQTRGKLGIANYGPLHNFRFICELS